MSKRILRQVLILNLFAFTAFTQAGQSKEYVVKQCYELAQTITTLVTGQPNPTCVDKLFLASGQMNTACTMVSGDSAETAKAFIDNSFYALQYAQFNGCNHYIEISHSKLEAHKLKHLL